MGRTAKYSEDLLLDAVIKYSDYCKSKIVATELAEWARCSIEGLEDVRDYNFTRKIKDPKTGHQIEPEHLKRINEINIARSIHRKTDKNTLLSTTNIERFYELSLRQQKEEIAEAREIISEYRSSNNYLRKQNDTFKHVVSEYIAKVEKIEKIVKEIKSKQAVVDKAIIKLVKENSEVHIIEKLKEIGISDGDFDLIKYNESLKMTVDEMLDIDKAIKMYQRRLTCGEGCVDSDNEISIEKNYINDLTDF